MPHKPQCRMDGCTRHCFATEDVCLPHFRMLNMTAGDEPVSPVPPGDSVPAGPDLPAGPVEPQPPTISALKKVWVEWAVDRFGVARATAEAATKSELIGMCREDDVES